MSALEQALLNWEKDQTNQFFALLETRLEETQTQQDIVKQKILCGAFRCECQYIERMGSSGLSRNSIGLRYGFIQHSSGEKMVINLSKLNNGVGPRKGAGVGLVWLPQPLPRLRWLKANQADEAYGSVERTGLLRTPDTGLG